MQKKLVAPVQGLILQATLPLPTGVNNMYRNVPGVGRVSTRELLLFKKEALQHLDQADVQDWEMIKFVRDCYAKRHYLPLSLEIIFYYRTMWKQDVDSGVKALQDLIFTFLKLKSFKLNDTLVIDLDVKKRTNPENPHCKFRLSFTQIGGEEW